MNNNNFIMPYEITKIECGRYYVADISFSTSPIFCEVFSSGFTGGNVNEIRGYTPLSTQALWAERAKRLIEATRREHKQGFVCDSVFSCKGWEVYGRVLIEDGYKFKYCPFCGKEFNKEKEMSEE